MSIYRAKGLIDYNVCRLFYVKQLAEALSYKPEGRGFDTRCCHWNLSLT